jgi:hypothetical protein
MVLSWFVRSLSCWAAAHARRLAATSVVVALGEDLLGDTHRGHGLRPAGVERQVREDLDQLRLGGAVLPGERQVEVQLLDVDLLFIQVALSAVMDRTRTVAPDLYRRYLTVFLDGIRADRGLTAPLPFRALTANQAHAAMTSNRRD